MPCQMMSIYIQSTNKHAKSLDDEETADDLLDSDQKFHSFKDSQLQHKEDKRKGIFTNFQPLFCTTYSEQN